MRSRPPSRGRARGWRLAAVRDQDALEKAKAEIAAPGRDVIAMLADVRRRGDAERLVQAAIAKWGRIDILVNNAGILRLAPLEDISEEQWDETLAVHLKGTFNCTQAVLPFMKQQHKGKIINIAAPSALRALVRRRRLRGRQRRHHRIHAQRRQ